MKISIEKSRSKKELIKKIFASILIFTIILNTVNIKPTYGATLQELQARYPDNGVWTGEGECDGFAIHMYEEYYGVSPSTYNVRADSLDQIQPGDIVRYIGSTSKHSVWITGRNGNTVTVAEANVDFAGKIRWGTKNISEFSNLEYILKAPYVLGTTPPTLSAPKNIKAEVVSNNGVKISWDKVDKAINYMVRIYRASDVNKGNFNNPVLSKDSYNGYNYSYIDDIKEGGDFYAFVHTKIGYNFSPTGGVGAKFSLKQINKIEISYPKTEFFVGEGFKVETKYYPTDANMNYIKVYSSDSSIATIEGNKYFKARKPGKVKIVAKAVNGVEETVEITVKAAIPVTRFELNTYNKTLIVGEGFSLYAKNITPENANDKKIKWTSYDKSVAKVTSDGYVTAIGKGETRIYAEAGNYGISCTITVKEGIPVSRFELNTYSQTLKVGQRFKLYAKNITPENATDKTIRWTSYDEDVAIVDSDGYVTAVGEGRAYLYAEAGNCGISCNITVQAGTPVTDIYLNKTSTELVLGDTETLKATIRPSDATIKTVTWSSSNPDVATVSSSGVVTPKKYGTTTITAKSTADNTKKATCTVKVYEALFKQKFIKLSKSTIVFWDLEKYDAELTNGKTAKVKLTSNNDNVCVTGSTIYGKNAGFATITGYDERYGNLKYICFVNDTVRLSNGKYRFPGDLNGNGKLDKWDVNLLKNAINAQNLTEDNKKVCDINGDGKYDNEDVEILNKIATENLITIDDIDIDSVSIMPCTTIIGGQKSYSIDASVYPENTTLDKTITYTSSDTSVATINKYGSITVLKPGKVTMTATASNNVKESIFFTFTAEDAPKAAVSGVTLNKSILSLDSGKAETLIATVTPNDATNQKVTWSSDNTAVATVSDAGLVTAKSEGTATITATSVDDNTKKASCTVTVTNPVSGVTLNKTTLSLDSGKTETLTATVTPSNATNQKVTWSSDNTAVATVSDTGVVTAKLEGTATITVTSVDDNTKTAKCTVTVTKQTTPTNPDKPVNPTPIKIMYGDLNKDNKISISDAIITLMLGVKGKATEEEKIRADVSGDGRITTADAILILMRTVNPKSVFPVEK